MTIKREEGKENDKQKNVCDISDSGSYAAISSRFPYQSWKQTDGISETGMTSRLWKK